MRARAFLVLQGPGPGDLDPLWCHQAVDAGLGAPPPLPTTVKAALYTGCSPLDVVGGHRRGRPDPALSDFIRTHSLLGRRPVRLLAALLPAAFRAPPTPLMLAAEAAGVPLPTLGDLRRGTAVAPDLTGDMLVRRGHAGVSVVTPEEAAARVEAWMRSGAWVVGEVDRLTPVETIRRFLAALDEVPWMGVLLPPEGVDPWPSQVFVAGNVPCDVGTTVADLLPRWWSP